MKIKLTYGELRLLLRENPKNAGRGGFQNYLIQLGYRVNGTSGELELDQDDLERLTRYVTRYGPGGYQTRVYQIFWRTLGEDLDWPPKPKRRKK